MSSPKTTLYEHDDFTFFWGLIDLGRFDAEEALQAQLGEGEAFVDLEVHDGTTIDGAFLSWLTLGMVNHREVVIRGRRQAPVTAPPGARQPE